MRTEEEVMMATTFVSMMASLARSEAMVKQRCSPEEMRSISRINARVFEVLEWVLGEDNQFGEMVKRANFAEVRDQDYQAKADAVNNHSRDRHRRRIRPPVR